MITLSLLYQFVTEISTDLDNPEVIAFKLYHNNKFLHIMLNKTGVTINSSQYYEWFRNKQLNSILC